MLIAEVLLTTEDRPTNQHQQPEVVHPKSYMTHHISDIVHQTSHFLLTPDGYHRIKPCGIPCRNDTGHQTHANADAHGKGYNTRR